MPITQQQQLALRRGLLYNASTNQLIKFDPVEANTLNVGQLPRLNLITVTIPIDAEGTSETVVSAFPPSIAGASINLTEDGKVEVEKSVWNRLWGVSGSKYIFIREILSADNGIPEVGDTVTEHPNTVDGLYDFNTTIEEINPSITLKIIDLSISSLAATSTFVFTILAEITTPLDFVMPIGVVGQKFIITKGSNLDSATLFIDGTPGFNATLKGFLGFTETTGADHTQVTFTNLMEDFFTSLGEFEIFTAGSSSVTLSNGRNQCSMRVLDDKIEFQVWRPYSNMSIFDNGSDAPVGNINNFSLVDTTAWGFSPPGEIMFNDLFGFIIGPSNLVFQPNTGNYEEPFNQVNSDIDSDLFCYKLSKPLINFISSSIALSKSVVTGLVLEEGITGQAAYVGNSINKNSLLEDWEAGYHKAGRILQGKLKK